METMPSFTDLLASRFLKQEDFPQPKLLTTRAFDRENVAPENQAPEMKWILYFNELERGLVLNKTNAQLLQQICGTNDTAKWLGRKVVVYTDPTVSFGGRVTGGVRIRAPKTQQTAPAPQGVAKPRQAAPLADVADDIPWSREPGDDLEEAI